MATARGARTAFVQGEKFLNQNTKEVFDLLDKGYGTATGALETGLGYFAPYADRFNAGSQLRADALGINGAEGNQRATAAFTAGPGYQFQLDQGLQALNRRRAAGGSLNSGNADADTLAYSQGLANQTYNNWLGQFANYDSLGLQTAGQQAGIQGGLANLATSDAAQRGQILSDATAAKIGLFSNAMAAGDAVKNQLTQNRLGAVTGGLNFLGNVAGGGAGGFTRLFG